MFQLKNAAERRGRDHEGGFSLVGALAAGMRLLAAAGIGTVLLAGSVYAADRPLQETPACPEAEQQAQRADLLSAWFTAALQGHSAETAKVFLQSYGVQMYDTGISLFWSDCFDPDYFFYLPLDEEGRVTVVACMRNEVSYLD